MVDIIAGTQASLTPTVIADLARYRHRVFVQTLGWTLTCQGDYELDQFDRADTIYVAARDSGRKVVGSARLLPTNQPYLLADIFPQLMGGNPLPRTASIWELSRFAAVDFDEAAGGTGGDALRQFSSPVAVALLRGVLDLAAQSEVERLITVSPLGIERLLRRAGFIAHRAAPPVVLDGHPLFACWIEVPVAQEVTTERSIQMAD